MWMTDGESDYHSLQSEFKQRGPWGLNLTVGLHAVGVERQPAGRAERVARPAPESAQPRRRIRAVGRRSAASAGDRLRLGHPVRREPRPASPARSLKGWQLAALGIFNSGSPIFINQDGDTLNVDSEEIRPNLVSGQDPTLPERRADDRALVQHRRLRPRHDHLRHLAAQSGGRPGPQGGRSLAGQGRSGCRRGQQLQFRVEAFNAFNWVNWSNPNGTLGNTNFGVISSAAAAREMQLSLRYTF